MADIMSFTPLWGVWEIQKLVGKGSFGSVYKAVKRDYGNTYVAAVKHLSIPNETMSEAALISEGIVKDRNSIKAYYDYLRDRIISEINFCYELKGNTNIVSYEDHYIAPKKTAADMIFLSVWSISHRFRNICASISLPNRR